MINIVDLVGWHTRDCELIRMNFGINNSDLYNIRDKNLMKIHKADDVSLSKWIAEASQAVNKIKSSFSLCRTLAISDAMAGHGRLSLPTPTLGYCQT